MSMERSSLNCKALGRVLGGPGGGALVFKQDAHRRALAAMTETVLAPLSMRYLTKSCFLGWPRLMWMWAIWLLISRGHCSGVTFSNQPMQPRPSQRVALVRTWGLAPH